MEQGKYTFSAACYCRLSKDDENDGTSVSIETQRQILSDYCKANQLNIYDFYCDDGFTGTNFERPDYKRMMSDIDSGLINTVIVKDLSRFGRNYIEVGKHIEEIFPEKGVRFIAIGDDVDTEKDNMDMDLLLPMKNIFNQFYPADCSRKTRQALKNKALNGEFIGSTAAYGYKKSAADKHILEIDEETAPVVERIFRMAAYENCGCNKIARILTAEKIMTPTAYAAKNAGRAYSKDPYDWNLTTVYKMIENQVYIGHTVNCRKRKISFKSKKVVTQPQDKWIIVENTHEPIVSEQLFKDANAQIASRKRERKNDEPHLFSGLVKCSTCGYSLSLSPKPNGKDFLTCTTYKKKGKDACSIHYIRCQELYDFVLFDIKRQIRLVLKDEVKAAEKLRKKMCSTSKSEIDHSERDAKSAEKRIKELDDRFYRLYEDKLNVIISEERFVELSRRCETELTDQKAKLERIRSISVASTEADKNIESYIALIKEFKDISALDKEIVHRLIDKITVSDKYVADGVKKQNITISYKFVGVGL